MAQAQPRAEDPPGGSPGPRAHRSRRGLFLPYILLLVVAVLWSAGWFYVRGRANAEIDAWLAREATAGRDWTCADRSLTGYPFRLELRCAAVSLARSDGSFRLGPVTAVVQVYQPRHALFEASGPFVVEQGDLRGEMTWSGLEGSFHGTADGFSRASLVIDKPDIRVVPPDAAPVTVTAKHLELHGRPTPGRFDTDGAVDVSLRLKQAVSAQADALAGNTAPSDLDLDAAINRAAVLRTGPVPRELERWREAGGSLDVTALSAAKGDRRLQAKGNLALDRDHRPAGQIEIRATGLDALVGALVGQRFGPDRGALVANLVGGLLGLSKPAAGEAPGPAGSPPLKALPPLRLTDGRVLLGGFPIPNLYLPVLY